MDKVIESFHNEMTNDKCTHTLYTLYRDSKLLAKVADATREPTGQAVMLKGCLIPLPRTEKEKSTKPHVVIEENRTLNNVPICGAYARTTGKPCRQPSMHGKGRCRLHGGKSTGRPITNGLKSDGYLKHERNARILAHALVWRVAESFVTAEQADDVLLENIDCNMPNAINKARLSNR